MPFLRDLGAGQQKRSNEDPKREQDVHEKTGASLDVRTWKIAPDVSRALAFNGE